jgi:hypothetical protein
LKEIVAARQRGRRELRGEIVEREALVKRYSSKMVVKKERVVSQEPEKEQGQEGEQSDVLEVQREQEAVPSPKRLKRYRNE